MAQTTVYHGGHSWKVKTSQATHLCNVCGHPGTPEMIKYDKIYKIISVLENIASMNLDLLVQISSLSNFVPLPMKYQNFSLLLGTKSHSNRDEIITIFCHEVLQVMAQKLYLYPIRATQSVSSLHTAACWKGQNVKGELMGRSTEPKKHCSNKYIIPYILLTICCMGITRDL